MERSKKDIEVKNVLLASLMFVLSCSISASTNDSHISHSPQCESLPNPQHQAVFSFVDKIEYREDLTRVYAVVVSRPHTSCRFDDFRLIDKDGVEYEFTDVDGIDAKRYFQWEDDGKIYIEIDFPVMEDKGLVTIKMIAPTFTLTVAGGND